MSREHEMLQRYYDGEIARDALPPELRAEADRFEQLLGVAFDQSVQFPRPLTPAVMRRVRNAADAGGWRALVRWVTAPRTVRVSPLAGALAAAGVVAVLLFVRPASAPDPDARLVPARFLYLAPQAARVAVTGDFVNWDPDGVPLQRRPDGVWVTELRLEPGLHHYVFVVDGTEWRADPEAASHVDDGFGRRNSVLLVTRRGHAS